MGIDCNTLRTMQGVSQKDIRCFAPHTRKTHELFHRYGNFPMVLGEKHVTAPLNILRFLAIEASGLNVLSELVEVGGSVVRSCAVLLKESASDHVDPFICTLR
jgi:hypothetical protein